MDHIEAGRYRDGDAEAWTGLARAGCDVYRDHLNTPAFFEMLPDVAGPTGLDIGCGEGHNTRLLARRGARMTAVDIAEVFIRHARQAEADEPPGVDYRIAGAVGLPFDDGAFDFAAGFMSPMDVPETDRVLAEASRVLKPGGFLQFSIGHPCFDTPHRENLRGPDGRTYAIEVGDHFRDPGGRVEEWLFRAAPPGAKAGPPKFRTPRFHRAIGRWPNLLIDTGSAVGRLAGPRPGEGTVRAHPGLQDAQVVPYLLHVRVRRTPAGPSASRTA